MTKRSLEDIKQHVIDAMPFVPPQMPLHTTLDTLLNRKEGNQCGHRAQLFQYLAAEDGYTCRIIHFRGHVCNQVMVDNKWILIDPTERPPGTELLYEHICNGPVHAIQTEWEQRPDTVIYIPCRLGGYSRYINQHRDVTIIHNIANIPVLVGMGVEELQLGIKSTCHGQGISDTLKTALTAMEFVDSVDNITGVTIDTTNFEVVYGWIERKIV